LVILLSRLGTLFHFLSLLLCTLLRSSCFRIRLMFGVNRRDTGQAQNGGDKENDDLSHVVSLAPFSIHILTVYA
jgi:hypothetical protein